MANTIQTKAEKVAEAKRLYCGIGLGQEDCALMIGDVIAAEIGVHPHTLDAWIIKFTWRRPSWYTKRRPYRRRKPGNVAKKVGGAIEAAASKGRPFPSNLALARRFKCSLSTIRDVLRALVDAGEIRTERDGPRRRLRLRDGRVTAWSVLANQLPPKAAKAQHHSRKEIVLRAVIAAAARGDVCPTTGELAIRAKCSRDRVGALLRELEAADAFKVDRARRAQRRFIFADGTATAWPGGSSRKPLAIDYAATEAITALRRMGHASVFDVAVVTGKAWGVTWSVDGKLYDRAALIAYASERRSAAIRSMQAAGVGA